MHIARQAGTPQAASLADLLVYWVALLAAVLGTLVLVSLPD